METKTKSLPMLARDCCHQEAAKETSQQVGPASAGVGGGHKLFPSAVWECSRIVLGQQELGAIVGQQRDTCKVPWPERKGRRWHRWGYFPTAGPPGGWRGGGGWVWRSVPCLSALLPRSTPHQTCGKSKLCFPAFAHKLTPLMLLPALICCEEAHRPPATPLSVSLIRLPRRTQGINWPVPPSAAWGRGSVGWFWAHLGWSCIQSQKSSYQLLEGLFCLSVTWLLQNNRALACCLTFFSCFPASPHQTRKGMLPKAQPGGGEAHGAFTSCQCQQWSQLPKKKKKKKAFEVAV